MAGAGGGGPFNKRPPEELSQLVRKAESAVSDVEFDTELSRTLGEFLVTYNDRDIDLVRDRLEAIKTALEGTIDGTVDQLFGGSVAKRTYIDGLSDIDSLVIVNGTELDGTKPADILKRIHDEISKKLGANIELSVGNMAVTINYSDGMSIQLLPAKRTDLGLKVPSVRHEGWSHINPSKFQDALTKYNQACGGKLVPVIKLAKAVISTLPESQRLSGYHVESLAIAAFKNYEGPHTVASMLPVFFEKSSAQVLSPIKDSTGQSVHVDGYLGAENSSERSTASHVLGRLARRMRNASAAKSTNQWSAMFDTDF